MLTLCSTRHDEGPVAQPVDESFDCPQVQAVMQIGPQALTDTALQAFAAHLERCSECSNAFDAVVPRDEGSPLKTSADLIDRLAEDVMRRLKAPASPALKATILTDYAGQLAPGCLLKGEHRHFQIVGLLGAGDFTETYAADSLPQADADAVAPYRVVVKIPRLSQSMSAAASVERLMLLHRILRGLAHDLKKLRGLSQVAQLIDVGDYLHRLSDRGTESTFLVYQFVDGLDLASHFRSHYAREGRFSGLRSADEFAGWARNLTQALLPIHNRLLLHGDICPKNVLIDGQGQPVFVDVGQSVFREVMSGGNEFSSYHYRAPEGVTAPSSDIYSLGGLLYFLATGRDPIGLGRGSDGLEAHKLRIEAEVKEANPELYRDDAAVVDLIAMCLRKEGRVQHLGALLKDINIFWREPGPVHVASGLDRLSLVARALDESGNALYRQIACDHLKSLTDLLEGLSQGFYDASGSPNTMRWAANALLSTLGTGDQFITTSLPAFWYRGNIGTNGRFLSMCRKAAARGAIVRRVLMLTPDLADPHLKQIVDAQLAAVAGLDADARGRFSVRYVLVPRDERRHLVDTGRHFGLLMKGADEIGMWPVYNDRDKLVTLRFRSGPRQTEGLCASFESIWGKAHPLADLVLPDSFVGRSRREAVS